MAIAQCDGTAPATAQRLAPARAIAAGGERAKARCKTQIEVGFGYAVTPEPVDSGHPVLPDGRPSERR